MQPHRSPEAPEFTSRLRARLADRSRRTADGAALRCAAVLVPLLVKDGEWHVVVTQRSQSVEHHKGQISFPGGACDADDADRLATALRETHEEIGIPPEAVEVLGALDDFPTISHFAVTPFVGVIPHPFPYRRQEREVEAVVEVPLGFLSESGRLRIEQWDLEGQTVEVLFWEYRGYTIWGATARILKELLDVIEGG